MLLRLVSKPSYIIGTTTSAVMMYGLKFLPNEINRKMIIAITGMVFKKTSSGLMKLSNPFVLKESRAKIRAIINDATTTKASFKKVINIIR
jgi:hypothetical protein